jgi:hypothetical protein
MPLKASAGSLGSCGPVLARRSWQRRVLRGQSSLICIELSPTVVRLQRASGGRVVREMLEVRGYGPDGYQI